MARTRKTATSTSKEQTSSGDNPLTCPECGKTFTRPASLGAHRNRTHGVSGTSTKRRRRGNRARVGQQAARRQTRGRAGSPDGARKRVDRDTLLRAVFPNGVPARAQVIQRANAWLDEAEELANTK